MGRFPTLQSLAAAPLEEVYNYWQGLGYYSRARSLHHLAQNVVNEYCGQLPRKRDELLRLKGIGPYTAASIAALAFNQPETVIDGNVNRIICRMYNLRHPLSEIGDVIRSKAEALTSREHPADYASAIMDLGAMVCTPKNPQCLLCPWRQDCLSKDSPDVEKIPQRLKLAKKEKKGAVYIISNQKGEIFIRQRTEKGLLSGLYEFPWGEGGNLFEGHTCQDTGLEVSHIFTHINLTLRIFTLETEQLSINGLFVAPQNFKNYAFSTLMKKIYAKIIQR